MKRSRLILPPSGTVRYEITIRAIGESRFIEISEEEFDALLSTSRGLADVLVLEEKLDLFLANYAEYEKELLCLAVGQMVWLLGEWTTFRAAFYAVNRRVLNVLSAGRLYLDQVQHALSTMYGQRSVVCTQVRARQRAEYDSSLAYRVVDVLRNYAQHRSMPIGRLSFPVHREGKETNEGLRFMVVPFLDVAELRQDPKIKRSVIDEIEATGKTNLSEILRSYVESIGRIHDAVREHTDTDVANWEALFEDARRRAAPIFGDDLVGLAVVKRRDDGTYIESADLVEHVFKGRRALRAKNGALVNFVQRYVTNAIIPTA